VLYEERKNLEASRDSLQKQEKELAGAITEVAIPKTEKAARNQVNKFEGLVKQLRKQKADTGRQKLVAQIGELKKQKTAITKQAQSTRKNITLASARAAVLKGLAEQEQAVTDNMEALKKRLESADPGPLRRRQLDQARKVVKLLEVRKALARVGMQLKNGGRPRRYPGGMESRGTSLPKSMWADLRAMKAQTGRKIGDIVLDALELYFAQPKMQSELKKARKKAKAS